MFHLKQFYTILSEIDVSSSSAKLSIQNGYYRPEIILSEKSFIETEDIRRLLLKGFTLIQNMLQMI